LKKAPRNQAGRLPAALKAAEADPAKLKFLYQILAGSIVTFGGFAAQEAAEAPEGGQARRFKLMFLRHTPEPGEAGAEREYAPFFSSPALARRLLKKMKIPAAQAALRTASGAEFLAMALSSGREAWLDPGGEGARVFSAEEGREIIRLAREEAEAKGPKDKISKQISRLKAEYSALTGEKLKRFRPTGDLPETLAETLDLARNCLGDWLAFSDEAKAGLERIPRAGDKKTIALAWRLLLALAQVYHLMRFRQKEFLPLAFFQETGLVLEAPEGAGGAPIGGEERLFLTDILKKDLGLRFSVLPEEGRLLVHGLEPGPSPAEGEWWRRRMDPGFRRGDGIGPE